MRIFPFSKHEALKPVCVESTVDTSLFINAISHGVLFMSLPLLTRRIGLWSPRKIRDKLALDKPAVSIWETLFCLFWSDAWESQVSEEADGLWPVHTFATTCLSPFHLSVFKTCSWFHVERFIKLPLFRLRISSVQNIEFDDVLSRWNVQSCAVWQVIHIMPSIL